MPRSRRLPLSIRMLPVRKAATDPVGKPAAIQARPRLPADNVGMECRPGCAACWIAPSLTTPIPGRGHEATRPKAAGEACHQLDDTLRCRLFGHASRPAVCASLQPSPMMCGGDRVHALQWLTRLELETRPT